MTPEEIKAKMMAKMKAAQDAASPKKEEKPAEASPSVGSRIMQGLSNMLTQDMGGQTDVEGKTTFEGGIGDAPAPIGLAKGLAQVIGSGSEMLPGVPEMNDWAEEKGLIPKRNKKQIEEGKAGVRALGEHYGNYRTLEGALKNFGEDPRGVTMDLTMASPIRGLPGVFKGGPKRRAANLVDKLVRQTPDAEAELARLAPDGGIVGDVLKKGGHDLIKKSTRDSANAHSIVHDATETRSMPDVRDEILIAKLKEANDAGRPAVHQAYEDAAAAGGVNSWGGGGIPMKRISNPKGQGYKEIPEDLEPLFTANPEIMKMYEESAVKTATRKATDGTIDNEFARLQATQTALREEAIRSVKDTRQGTSGKSRADMFNSAADHIDGILEKHSGNYPEAIRLHRELQQKKADIELQHKLDTKQMKETERAVHKGETNKGPPPVGLNDMISLISGGIGSAGLASGRPELAIAGFGAAGGAVLTKAVRNLMHKRSVSNSPELAKLLADSKLPIPPKRKGLPRGLVETLAAAQAGRYGGRR